MRRALIGLSIITALMVPCMTSGETVVWVLWWVIYISWVAWFTFARECGCLKSGVEQGVKKAVTLMIPRGRSVTAVKSAIQSKTIIQLSETGLVS
jgi:hypothetical protein